MSLPPVPDRALLRRELRERRRALSDADQRRAARGLVRQLCRLPALGRARRIALYWPMDGEIDPRRLAHCPGFRARALYLPVLRPFPPQTLAFARWRPGARLHRNRFGIPEPRGRAWLPAARLDAVLLPLTGFDAAGNRLGMGGGFYDRTLAGHRRSDRPLLVGVAHACQQVERLPTASWDVPLAVVVTDRRRFA